MKYKKIKIQLIILLTLLIIIEMFLRINNRPGTLKSAIYPLDSIQYEPLFKGDSLGITSFIKDSKILPEGYIINNEGFRSPFPFDKKIIDSFRIIENKKIIFLIGDSYTEGCCAGDIKNSFADLLSQKEEYCILELL